MLPTTRRVNCFQNLLRRGKHVGVVEVDTSMTRISAISLSFFALLRSKVILLPRRAIGRSRLGRVREPSSKENVLMSLSLEAAFLVD